MPARIQDLRAERGWSQAELADRAGVTRQLVGAVEAGRHSPSVAAAIAIARALGTTVEDLFHDRPEVTSVLGRPIDDGAPVMTASVGDRPVVVPLVHAVPSSETWALADAHISAGRLEWLPGAARAGLVVAGCDPLLGPLAGLVKRASPHRMIAVHASTGDAVDSLASRRVHAALVHGPRDLLPPPPVPVRRWQVARWQVGLASRRRAGPPSIEELAERRPRIVRRDPGAASQGALTRALQAIGSDAEPPGPVAGGHLDVARRVATAGPAAGVTMEPAAMAFDLSFSSLEEHEVELWLDERWISLPAAGVLLETLTGDPLASRAARLPGYDLAGAGTERRVG